MEEEKQQKIPGISNKICAAVRFVALFSLSCDSMRVSHYLEFHILNPSLLTCITASYSVVIRKGRALLLRAIRRRSENRFSGLRIYILESAQKCVCAFLCELNINWTSFSVVMSEWSRRVVVVVV